jgi:uncharacterized membrane protein YhaH (DUF805 family)
VVAFDDILFSFRGRIGRLTYFGYSMLVWIILSIMGGIHRLVMTLPNNGVGDVLPWWATYLTFFAIGTWVLYALQAKRLHDLGFSGLHLIWISAVWGGTTVMVWLSPVLAVIGGLFGACVYLWLYLAPGQPEENRFGLSPKSLESKAVNAPTNRTAWKSYSSRA